MPHTPLPPFAATSGPRTAKIALVGEAWGEQEALLEQPFVGSSGQELTRMLAEAGISRRECFLTNTLALRPPENKIEALCTTKSSLGPDALTYPAPPLSQGKYLLPEYLPELQRLSAELTEVSPNLVIALGATACWAMLQVGGISSRRGVVAQGLLVPGLKVLPTYHPSAVLRNWALRVVVVADLLKAQRESKFPEVVRPRREILINPTLEELSLWEPRLCSAPILGVDIETASRQITCICFAPSPSTALVVPFWDRRSHDWSYWPSAEAEGQAWGMVRRVLESPAPKVFQNGLYDLQYIARMGIRPKACQEDTMLFHHSLYPELQKGLGFLGSIYTNEASWKLMRRRGGEELKKDE